MKKPSRLTIVLFGLCAVIWIAAFIVNLKRYRGNKED